MLTISNVLKRFSSNRSSMITETTKSSLKYGAKLRGRKFLASSYGKNMPEYLSYTSKPNLKIVNLHQSSDNLKEVAIAFRFIVDNHINNQKAILFKRLPIKNEHDFNLLIKHTCYDQLDYSTGHYTRQSLVDNVYESSNEPPDCSIDPHNEMAYLSNYPKKVLFCCIIPATVDGETPVCFNTEFFPKLDQTFVSKVREKKIRYLRYFGDKRHTNYMAWQDLFNTNSCQEVERIIQNTNNQFKWNENGTLTTWHIGEPFITDPITGEEIWFNQIAAAHRSYYVEHPDFYDNPNLTTDQIPLHTTYGDGEEIEPEYIIHHREVQWNNAIGFKWEKGDILVLNNLHAQHGRLSYEGERKLVVSLLNE